MEYASMGLLRFADVLDPERSEVEFVIDYKGDVTDCWQITQQDPRVPFARMTLLAGSRSSSASVRGRPSSLVTGDRRRCRACAAFRN